MNYVFSLAAAALLVVGLAGNGYEMRRARQSTVRDEDTAPRNFFGSKRNLKWFALIGAAIALAAVGANT